MDALIGTISRASWKSWWQTILWVGYHVLGGLMPIWASYFLLRLYHQPYALNDFAKHGEFAIYAATFFAITLPQVVRNIRDAKYVLGTGAVLFAIAGLVFSALIYSGVVIGPQPQKNLDEMFLFHISIVLFLCSLGFAVVVTLIENEQAAPNVRKAEEHDQKVLKNKFISKEPEITPEIPDIEMADIPSQDELAARFVPKNEGLPEENEEISHG